MSPTRSGEIQGPKVASRRAVRPAGMPRWAVFAAIIGMTFMLCLTINYRAFSEMSREVHEHDTLTNDIETLTDENLALQEEIHNLKSDSKSIEREAKSLACGVRTESAWCRHINKRRSFYASTFTCLITICLLPISSALPTANPILKFAACVSRTQAAPPFKGF